MFLSAAIGEIIAWIDSVDQARAVRLPKSLIRMDGDYQDLQRGEFFQATMPEWLAKEKGLI